jgi:hypothetical protein
MSFYAPLVAQKGRMAAAKINYGVGLKVLTPADWSRLM